MRSQTSFHKGWFFLVSCMLLFFSLAATACSDHTTADHPAGSDAHTGIKQTGPLRDNTPEVLAPHASGTVQFTSDICYVDASNTSEGYVMAQYNGSNEKVKFQVTTPDQKEYTYLVTDYGEYEVYPLPGGNGTYTLTLLESVSREEDLYAVSFTQDIDVTVTDEFKPYLYPNKYVNFSAESEAVNLGKTLAIDCYTDLDVVANIYNYVIENIDYDEKKAKNVAYGYTPDINETLSSKKGICFDYAALMSGMLRTQKIPTKLEVGYAGDVYHAWISCYVDEIGWVDNIIEFDGKNWSLMDPTLAANNKDSDVKKYMGDGSRYVVKYTY